MPRGMTRYDAVRWVGLVASPLLAAVVYSLLPDSFSDTEGQLVAFSHAGRMTAAAWRHVPAVSLYSLCGCGSIFPAAFGSEGYSCCSWPASALPSPSTSGVAFGAARVVSGAAGVVFGASVR